MKTRIPEPPKFEELFDKNEDKLQKWVKYFKGLSPRIEISTSSNINLELYKRATEKMLGISRRQSLVCWPQRSEITFLVNIDTSPSKYLLDYSYKNVYLFCFGDTAFGLRHFAWDGDSEENYDCRTFSLGRYSKKALSWKYIAKLIKDRLIEIENSVPNPPKT